MTLGPGQLFVVPQGVAYRPVADDEVHVLLLERAGTPNAGGRRAPAPRMRNSR